MNRDEREALMEESRRQLMEKFKNYTPKMIMEMVEELANESSIIIKSTCLGFGRYLASNTDHKISLEDKFDDFSRNWASENLERAEKEIIEHLN